MTSSLDSDEGEGSDDNESSPLTIGNADVESDIVVFRRPLLLSEEAKRRSKTLSLNQKRNNRWRRLARALLAEVIGVFIIVNFGCAAAMAAVYDDAHTGLFQVAAVWFIAVTVAVATTAPLSGAHLNPAISIAIVLVRPSYNFSCLYKLLLYIVAQVLGAFLGAATNLIMYREKITQFEEEHRIIRGSEDSIASARTFGAYYL